MARKVSDISEEDLTMEGDIIIPKHMEDEINKIVFQVTNGNYSIPSANFHNKNSYLSFPKLGATEKFSDPSRQVNGIMTDIVTKEFAKSPASNTRFLNLVYQAFQMAIDKYIKDNVVKPAGGIIFIYKGGSVLRMIRMRVNELMGEQASNVLDRFYSAFFKKSDADFSIYIHPDITTKNSRVPPRRQRRPHKPRPRKRQKYRRRPKLSAQVRAPNLVEPISILDSVLDDIPTMAGGAPDGFEEVFKDMRNLSYLVQVYLRAIFMSRMSDFFDFYKYNDRMKRRVLWKYFSQVRTADHTFKNPENDDFNGAIPVSLFYDNIIVGDHKIIDAHNVIGQRMKDGGISDISDVGSRITTNERTDIRIEQDHNNPNNIAVSAIDADHNPFYISANSTLQFYAGEGTARKIVRFDLVRTKASFQLKMIKPYTDTQAGNITTGTPYVMEVKNFGGEVIDCSIPHKDTPDLAHFWEELEHFTTTFKMKTPDGSAVVFTSYSLHYYIRDLHNMLFTERVPWADAKYEKRINRIIYLYSYELITTEDMSDQDKQMFISDMKAIYDGISFILQNEYNKLAPAYISKLTEMIQRAHDHDLFFSRILTETVRLMTDVVPNDASVYVKYIGFVKAVVKNLDVMQEAYNTRLSFVIDNKGSFPRDAIYEDIDSEDFARQDGGATDNARDERRYYKYKAKYMKLKRNQGLI